MNVTKRTGSIAVRATTALLLVTPWRAASDTTTAPWRRAQHQHGDDRRRNGDTGKEPRPPRLCLISQQAKDDPSEQSQPEHAARERDQERFRPIGVGWR